MTAWKNKKIILHQLEEKRASSETEDAKLVDKNTGEIPIIPSPDDPHTDKNIVAEHDNYVLANKERRRFFDKNHASLAFAS